MLPPPPKGMVLRRFGLKTGIVFAYSGLNSGMVFEGIRDLSIQFQMKTMIKKVRIICEFETDF